MEGHKLVFLAGLHRSGTTLLARLLAAHPEVSGFAVTAVPADEGQHLQDVYPSASVYGGPGRSASPRSRT
jgi:N-acetyl-gamma-glutamylphosphate reductase